MIILYKTKIMLSELIDNTKTDKNTSHSYIYTYERLFHSRKYENNRILEIGIGEPKNNKQNGGSIKLWYDYFPNSIIYGLDIHDISNINDDIQNKDRIKLYTSVDAYSDNFVENMFIQSNTTFDILIDDGPHTLESMKIFIHKYLPLLNSRGIMVIEDIPDMDWIQILRNCVPTELRDSIEVVDLRYIKNRWDDIMMVIHKP